MLGAGQVRRRSLLHHSATNALYQAVSSSTERPPFRVVARPPCCLIADSINATAALTINVSPNDCPGLQASAHRQSIRNTAIQTALPPCPIDRHNWRGASRECSGLPCRTPAPPTTLAVRTERFTPTAKAAVAEQGNVERHDQPLRTQWRLMLAIELLATGRNIGYCAFKLGFASDSAFIAFFKDMTGITPGDRLR